MNKTFKFIGLSVLATVLCVVVLGAAIENIQKVPSSCDLFERGAIIELKSGQKRTVLRSGGFMMTLTDGVRIQSFYCSDLKEMIK